MQNISGITKQSVELVFRTVGERTSEKALELAKKCIKPSKVHVIENVRPFSRAVEEILSIKHESSHVVYVDADCLLFEDMSAFLEYNTLPFVDCYVRDRFRGRVNCGVHIVRSDVIEEMRKIRLSDNESEYLLRPESYLRNKALQRLGLTVQYKNFTILHDYLQRYEDIFAKYVLREIRSRNKRRQPLSALVEEWDIEEKDFQVARAGIEYAIKNIPNDMDSVVLKQLINNLPKIAKNEVEELRLPQQTELTEVDVEKALEESKNTLPIISHEPKVFGIGLSRTGTHSLTVSLHILGYDTVHNPIDEGTLRTLESKDAQFPLLDFYNGITDITTVPVYKKLDELYPESKFILTIRDEESWLESCRRHWSKSEPKDTTGSRLAVRKLLREKVYGTESFDEDLFREIYRRHVAEVKEYFKNREDDLLVLNIINGEGYEKLVPFLGVPVPQQRFPYLGRAPKT